MAHTPRCVLAVWALTWLTGISVMLLLLVPPGPPTELLRWLPATTPYAAPAKLVLDVSTLFESEAGVEGQPPIETVQEDPLVAPGPPWAALSQEELSAAAAASYPVTMGPPVVSGPHAPLLSRFRRRSAGVHPLGARAPVHGAGNVKLLAPHTQWWPSHHAEFWRRRYATFAATPEASPTAMPVDLPTPLRPLAPVRSAPLVAPQVHLKPAPGAGTVLSQALFVAQAIFYVLAAAALANLAAQAYRSAAMVLLKDRKDRCIFSDEKGV